MSNSCALCSTLCLHYIYLKSYKAVHDSFFSKEIVGSCKMDGDDILKAPDKNSDLEDITDDCWNPEESSDTSSELEEFVLRIQGISELNDSIKYSDESG